ncbi:MAG: cell division protein FtsA, partial [Candidatus Acidiferrales bacterium]
MGKKDRYLVGLDIGSTKTCALVGEIEEQGGVKFAGLGAAESKGWRKGQIVNLELAVSSIRRAVEEAENIVGVPVESALVGIAGSHVRGVNSRGGIALGQRPRDIHREDVRRAVEVAKSVKLPEDREVLHVLPQEFFVDSQDNIHDAIGMVGQKLEVNVHIVTASATAT